MKNNFILSLSNDVLKNIEERAGLMKTGLTQAQVSERIRQGKVNKNCRR